MIFKLITKLLFISLLPLIASGQSGFDGIKICHDETGALKKIQAGNYIIELIQSRLASLRSADNEVNYNATDRRIYLESNAAGKRKFLSIQLTSQGLLLSTKDTSVTISLITTPMPSMISETRDTTVSLQLGDVFVPIEFKSGRPYRIYFGLSDKFLTLLIQKTESKYIWNFIIQSTTRKSNLTYVEFEKYAPHITVQDETEKVGISLYSLKSDRYKMLMGLGLAGNNWNGSGPEYQLKYNKRGSLKKSKTKFNLSCE